MIEIGKVFAARGLVLAILIVKLPHDTGVTGPFLAGVTAANPSISFHHLPLVDLPPMESGHPKAVTFEVAHLSNPHLHDFLARASLAVLVVDLFCCVVVDIAAELRVPTYFFFMSGAEVWRSLRIYVTLLNSSMNNDALHSVVPKIDTSFF